eukprot:GHRR01019810.1.p2 GENE.GHRR01019810.1~~GHRR01019810.1.p2  ORF type:complete len:102 (-),score=21.72 GHRR01019810.1:1560-1865(-)
MSHIGLLVTELLRCKHQCKHKSGFRNSAQQDAPGQQHMHSTGAYKAYTAAGSGLFIRHDQQHAHSIAACNAPSVILMCSRLKNHMFMQNTAQQDCPTKAQP